MVALYLLKSFVNETLYMYFYSEYKPIQFMHDNLPPPCPQSPLSTATHLAFQSLHSANSLPNQKPQPPGGGGGGGTENVGLGTGCGIYRPPILGF